MKLFLINNDIDQLSVTAVFNNEKGLSLILVCTVIVFGIYILFLSLTDVSAYTNLIQEYGVLESSSAIFWILSAIIASHTAIKGVKMDKNYNFLLFPSLILIFFFILCAGEELSWGRRILFGTEVPKFMEQINVQNEFNIHNIGSTSIFSNAFFLLTLFFFLYIPYIVRSRKKLKKVFRYNNLPIPHRSVVIVFLISLFIWIFIGIRFGTLGFHPFSFFKENYYTQMDDEIFEFLAAYSFLCFALFNSQKKIIVTRLYTDK